jgi:hypothetical protein
MRRRGLLHKTKLSALILFVLCYQWLGSYQLINITSANDEISDGSAPLITITSPVTDSKFNQTSLTVSGAVKNFTTDIFIVLVSGSNETEPVEVVEGSWTTVLDLQTEGQHSFYAIATDTNGATVTDLEGIAYKSNTIDITIDTTSPQMVEFISPIAGTITNYPSIEVKSEELSTVQICIDCPTETNIESWSWKSVSEDSNGKWIYEDPQLADGEHTIYARAIDNAGNVGNHKSMTFTLDKTRPIISPNVTPKQDMTQVSIRKDTKVQVTVIDTTPINIENIDDINDIPNLINIYSHGSSNPVPGKVGYDQETKMLTFTPIADWAYSTKYTVSISPSVLFDSAGNGNFPRLWSFTTETIPATEVNNELLHELSYNGENIQRESPHAVYKSNVNTCANCHSSHEATSPNLLDQKKNTHPNSNANLLVDEYCMACHDGTVAPVYENRDSTHMHDAAVNIAGKPSGSSCSSCHNPHSDWSPEDPNLAQGHIIYTHKEETPANPEKPIGEISSKEQLCESCHESDSGDRIVEANGYRFFQYKKSSTAIGIFEDYELCLRCHNEAFQKKYAETPDIARYYGYWTEKTKLEYEDMQKADKNLNYLFEQRVISEGEKSFSGHIIKARDGSPLIGQLPCAECHDTHGSNNIKQLKTLIGHENPKPFEALSGDWDAAKERMFCVTCHNGETGIYGITGTAIYDKITGIAIDPARTAHNKENSEACSKCHSNNDSFIEAAHAPKRIKVQP